jgi:hypothetical protein
MILAERSKPAGPYNRHFSEELSMDSNEKKELEIESLEAIEVEDEDLEDVSGGFTDNNCGCVIKPSLDTTSGS